jgi:hypothetical protein
MSECRFHDAYRFATGRVPPPELSHSHGERPEEVHGSTIRCPNGDEERSLPLCQHHAELMRRFGYLALMAAPLSRSGGHR